MQQLAAVIKDDQPIDSSLVHTLVTTCISPLPSTLRERSVRAHAAKFQRSEILYDLIDLCENSDKLSLLKSCRTIAGYMCHEDTKEVRMYSNSCKLRWCPMCAQARQNFLGSQIAPWLKHVRQPKLLTLTLRSSNAPLISQIDFIYRSFQKLRKRKWFMDLVLGGVWFFQVTRNDDTGQFHPHIHVLLDSEYLAQKKLKELWSVITGGSDIVDIRLIYNQEYTIRDVSRYAATPMSLVDLPVKQMLELYDAFKGRRLVGCFGTAKEISLRPTKPPDSDKWIKLGSESFVLNLYGIDSRATAIVDAYNNHTPLPPGNSLLEFEHRVEGRAPPDLQPRVIQDYLPNFYD